MNRRSISRNLESTGRNDRPSKKESNSVHVSMRLQRDSETREYTKAHNGLSHNLALPGQARGNGRDARGQVGDDVRMVGLL